jgi:4'-phosphopantetheinyl transferase EntD
MPTNACTYAALREHRPISPDVTSNARPKEAIAGLRTARWHHMHRLNGADVPIRLLEFEVSEFDPHAFAAAGIFCPPRIARSVHKRQAEFFFGRLAARDALAATEVRFAMLDVGIGTAREPLWPAGVIGSITHDHRYAAAAVKAAGYQRGIGIDIARVIGREALPSLWNTVIDAQEVRVLHAQGHGWSSAALLTLAFSAKESLYKAAYRAVGQIFDFDAARIVALEPLAGRLRLRLTQTLCGDFIAGQECELGFEFLDPGTLITYFVW